MGSRAEACTKPGGHQGGQNVSEPDGGRNKKEGRTAHSAKRVCSADPQLRRYQKRCTREGKNLLLGKKAENQRGRGENLAYRANASNLQVTSKRERVGTVGFEVREFRKGLANRGRKGEGGEEGSQVLLVPAKRTFPPKVTSSRKCGFQREKLRKKKVQRQFPKNRETINHRPCGKSRTISSASAHL